MIYTLTYGNGHRVLADVPFNGSANKLAAREAYRCEMPCTASIEGAKPGKYLDTTYHSIDPFNSSKTVPVTWYEEAIDEDTTVKT